jgi:hypothetical protein
LSSWSDGAPYGFIITLTTTNQYIHCKNDLTSGDSTSEIDKTGDVITKNENENENIQITKK